MAYAVIRTGGKQYRVQEGDQIDIEKVDLDVGDKAAFTEILLVSDGESTRVGNPLVEGVSVTAEIVSHHRAPKVTAFRFRRRKGYHRTRGHRQPLTRVAITSITG